MLLQRQRDLLRPGADGQLGWKIEVKSTGRARRHGGTHAGRKQNDSRGETRYANLPAMQPAPGDALRRVLRLSRLNGWSVAVFAGLCSLASLAFGDLVGFGVGVLVALGGALEVAGHRRLKRRDPGGVALLVRSQFVVLGVIWAYALPRLLSFDAGYLQAEAIPNLRQLLAASGLDLDALLAQSGLDAQQIVPLVHLFFVVLYGSVMLATLVYQGGLALYYRRRREAVEAALRAPPLVPATTPGPPPPEEFSI